MMNILWSLARWSIFNWKAAQIYADLNSGAKKKNEYENQNFQKNTISEAETMEFGQKMMNIL